MLLNELLGMLTLTILAWPIVLAIVVALLGRASPKLARQLAVYSSALHVIAVIGLIVISSPFMVSDKEPSQTFEPYCVPGDPGVRGSEESFSHTTSWGLLQLAPKSVERTVAPTIQFFIGVDGLSLGLVALTSLMTFFAGLISWNNITERIAGYYAWLLALQAAVTGAFLSFDIVLFYLFFELTLVPAFFLIGSWGVGGGRRDAARKFFLYTLFGSLFMLIGIIGVVRMNPTPLHPETGMPLYAEPIQSIVNTADKGGAYKTATEGPITFSIPQLMKNAAMWDRIHHEAVLTAEERVGKANVAQSDARTRELQSAQTARDARRSFGVFVFFALMAGLAVKIPIVPFHTWLPSAYGEAPIAITMLLSGVLAKLGTYGVLRIVAPLVPEATVTYGLATFGTLGAIGVVYAAFCAYAQRDLKLLAAYSSVSHLGFLVIGLFALNQEAMSGAVLHMINHGLSAGALFALLAFLANRYQTLDANQYGGLLAKYPRYAFFMFTICLAGVGLPGLNNFVSEMLMLAGLFDVRNTRLVGYGLAVVSAVGILLSSWYVFTMLRRVFFGPLIEPTVKPELAGTAGDLGGRELMTAFLMTGGCLVLGLYPQPVLDLVSTDVERICYTTNQARLRLDPSAIAPVKDPKPVPAVRTGMGGGPPPAGGGAGGPPRGAGGPPRGAGGPPATNKK